MTKIPRSLNGRLLCKRLERLGYFHDRNAGDHFIMVTRAGERIAVSVPQHKPLKVGTLNSILKDVAAFQGLTVSELLQQLGL